MFVAEKFIRSLVENMESIQFTLMVVHGYPPACKILRLKHYLHSPLEKSLIERVVQYFKDRVEYFDDYYPCNSKRRDCDNGHVYNWVGRTICINVQ